jgi:hypothetical protein
MIRGQKIRTDAEDRISLNDVHAAAGFEKNRLPNDWIRLPATARLIEAVLVRITGKSRNWTKTEIKSVYYRMPGAVGGTFADARVALAYAEYLNPKLAVEVREVFLRYRAGDAVLADETLQRSTPEGNEWAAVRALSRAKRRQYTDTLQAHGVEGFGYAQCTDETYRKLFGAAAKRLKQVRGIPAKANLRDNMPSDELVYVMAAEVLASGRINEEDSTGTRECRRATGKSASFIRQAIEADKADRRPRLA